jgi:hypothetical protein
MLAGQISFGLTSPTRADVWGGSLVAYTSDLAAFCCSLPKKQRQARLQLVDSGSLIRSMIMNLDWTMGSSWIVGRTAVIIFLLLCVVEAGSNEEEEILVQVIKSKMELQRIPRTSPPWPLFWTMITDLDTFQLESPSRMQRIARLLYVISKFSESTRHRLDHFLWYKLSGHVCSEYGGTVPRGFSSSIDSLEAFELTGILAAMWQDMNDHVAVDLEDS